MSQAILQGCTIQMATTLCISSALPYILPTHTQTFTAYNLSILSCSMRENRKQFLVEYAQQHPMFHLKDQSTFKLDHSLLLQHQIVHSAQQNF